MRDRPHPIQMRRSPTRPPHLSTPTGRHHLLIWGRSIFGSRGATTSQHFYKVPRSLEEDFYPDRVANEATICVIRAKKLLSVQKDKQAADAMVSLSLRGKEKHTRVVQKTLWPLWGQAFYLPALDASSVVECTVDRCRRSGSVPNFRIHGSNIGRVETLPRL